MGAETYLDIEPCAPPDNHNSSSEAGSSSVPATHWRPTIPAGELSQVLSHPRMAVAAKRADALADARVAASSSSSSSEAGQHPGALRRNFTELTWKLVSGVWRHGWQVVHVILSGATMQANWRSSCSKAVAQRCGLSAAALLRHSQQSACTKTLFCSIMVPCSTD
jgi:hypothetical protein